MILLIMRVFRNNIEFLERDGTREVAIGIGVFFGYMSFCAFFQVFFVFVVYVNIVLFVVKRLSLALGRIW